MEKNVQLFIEDTPVRFTPAGKVYVVDAIRAVSESREPGTLWEQMKQDAPEILSCVSEFQIENTQPVAVADSACWEKIQDILINRLLLKEDAKQTRV